MKRFLGHSVVQ